MRVLITNTVLGTRGGSESFVRDLARGLQNLGHSVLAYGSDVQQQERLLESDLVPVATDLEHLPFMPDVIHGQHHLDAMTALTALPGVPALFHCHGAVWREAVPRHPRIHRYLTVSRTLAERIAIESCIPPADITVLPNAVDMARFATIRTPRSRPARALFYNRRHGEDSATLAAIRDAAARHGLTLDCAGIPIGPEVLRPEAVLPTYDVVFASGVSAIEALACGCAVVVLGRTSCGELVRPDNVDRYRQVNFSIAVNSPPPSADKIAAELDLYSASDGEALTARVRVEADFQRSVEILVRIYETLVERQRALEPDPRAELLAASRYLRRIVPLIKMTDRMLDGQWSAPARATSFDELRADLAILQRRIQQADPQ